MAVMPLFPKTKMADARKQSVTGTHWPREPQGQYSKLRPPLQFRPAFLEPTLWQECSINMLIFQHSLSFHIFTYSLQCDFQKERYHSLISTKTNILPQKCICHATILLLVIPFRWDFFQLQKQQKFRQFPKERNKQNGRRHIPPNIHY